MIKENSPGISFSLKRRRVLIYRSTLRSLSMPGNIRFLLNMKKKRVAVQACEAIDRDSFKVPDFTDHVKDQYEISSIHFISILYKTAGWDRNKSYRIKGTVFAGNRLVEFVLDEAEIIADEEFVDPDVEQG